MDAATSDDVPAKTPAAPTTPTTPAIPAIPPMHRIHSLDVLRGVALLGILLMNVQSFSMIEAAYFNPTAYGDLTGANYWVWYLSHLLVDSKFMAIFSMMFGASMLLILDKAAERGKRPFTVHARRNLFLLAIGAAHGYLLWSGDILFPYAVCSFIVFLFRNRRPQTLVIAGLVFLAVGSLISVAGGFQPDTPEFQEEAAMFHPSPEMVAEELAIYRSGWWEQMPHRVDATFGMHTIVMPFYFVWRVCGMMLLGMALFRWGVLSAERSRKFYGRVLLLGIFVGLPLVHAGVHVSQANDWAFRISFFHATQFNYWGSLFVALGWISVVMLVCQSRPNLWILSPLASVGRMAFSNYLFQTVFATTLFYGHGMGRFGEMERVEQLAFVVSTWVVQLVLSSFWLRRFRYGPAEWVWRWATYGQRPPFRRSIT